MQPNGDLRPVTRSQTYPDRGNSQNTVARTNHNGTKRGKATSIKNDIFSSPSHSDSDYAQSPVLSSGRNLSARENSAPVSLLQSGDSDDPLNSLRSERRELAIQADNDLKDSRRFRIKTDTFMSDKLFFKHTYAESLDRLAELNVAAGNVQNILGQRVTERLMRRITQDMQTVVVQPVIQSVLAKTCQNLIQRWSVSSQEHDLFATSYKKYRKINSFETMAQWRAATREIFKYGPQSDGTRDFVHGAFIENLLDVLRIAGWKNFAPKETIQEMFGDRIRELVKLTIRLDRAIMEGALSQELHLFMPGHDDTYDPNMMVDINQDPSAPISDGKVAVCVSVGLKLAGKRTDEGETKGLEASSATRPKVLLKAKVVLDAVLGI
ncbi:hypothetical protein IW261DRAFT_1612017 [Armillaria novae-zelandiae]|uniref:Uncharacterized protein n=1 Tax=Armillaria novae-zelandiae TaxID=153914 RepID=A0AA39NUB0_9AGAR|nr:hypothetical protein IW261DRAFT_1612017 [Armillaria novae-zelandiae]